MYESDMLAEWVRAAIGYSIWFVLLLVFWRVILSLRAVQESGFAILPFQSEVFPAGLPWVAVINTAFLTIIIISVLSLGGRLRALLLFSIPQLPPLGSAGYHAGVLSAVIIGYFAYADLVLPLLYLQGVEWVYKLIFWILVAGISAVIVFDLVQAVLAVRVRADAVIRMEGATSKDGDVPRIVCRQCGASLDPGYKYCPECGTPVQEEEDANEKEAE